MEKVKLLTFAVIALLLLNFGTLGFLVFSRNGDGKHGQTERREPKYAIIEKLHFDKDQQAQYEKLIQGHRAAIDRLENDIMLSRTALYRQLAMPVIDEKSIDSITGVISDYQQQVEMTHFLHFADIKSLCRPEQQRDFDVLTRELAYLFSHPRPHP